MFINPMPPPLNKPPMHPFSHCHFCGTPFADAEATFPRRCESCGNPTYRNPLPVAVLCIPVGKGLLAVKRTIPPYEGKFALPGGYINHGESWQAAAVREVQEETGLIIEATAVQIFDARNAPDGTLLVFGLIDALDYLPDFTENEEASEIAIITNPAELAFPLHTEAMQRYLDMFQMFEQMSGVLGIP